MGGLIPTVRIPPFNHFPSVSCPLCLRYLLPLLMAGVLLALTGCGEDSRQSYATETDEPYYRQAEQMKRSGRQQEALSAYLKVIEKRGDDAPESHLESGLLYLHHIRDPIAAIYHFRKFLALRPNSAQAPLVRQRIDAAIRDFARTLPAQPVENQLQRVDLIAAMDKLKLENDLLKQQISELQPGRGEPAMAVGASGTAARAATGAGSGDFSISVDIPTVRTRPTPARTEPTPARTPPPTQAAQTRQAAASTPASTSQNQAAPARAGTRRHVVRPGDTLSKLAQEYYGNRARWRDIYQANRNTMRNESDLKVGLELIIPQ
jgi:LysM repeat protein